MSGSQSRLAKLASHFWPSSSFEHSYNIHTLSPTIFLPRAAAVEPDGPAAVHETTDGKIIRRTWKETADRSRGFAYYLRKKGYKRVGILASNTPAFLEAMFAIAAASAVNVAINYRLQPSDLEYIFDHADVDSVLVDAEFVPLLDLFRKSHPNIPFIIDSDIADESATSSNEYARAVHEGLQYDAQCGGKGWAGLEVQAPDENATIALAYTSGTTARPKGVEYTHRGAYMAAMGNVVESNLNLRDDRARYLWTLPMFHACGWTFPWAVTAVRATHYFLRKIDYPKIWGLLKNERITHFNAAPTVNTLLCNDEKAERLPQVVQVTVAASPPTGHLFEMMTKLNLHPTHVYGLTETYGPITKGYPMPAWNDLPDSEKYAKLARQGHGFITSLAVRVIKAGESIPLDHIEDVARDGKEVGDIIFTGNICAKGYYKDPEATKKLFAGGVLHSGDLAVWHPDGAIQIIDRGKDIIISGGENISSLSLESLLVQHPSILECAVVAVQDEKWGERPYAFVTIKEGANLTGEEVLKWAKGNDKISGFMMPRECEIVKELPKTSTGKLRKNVLRDWTKGAKRETE